MSNLQNKDRGFIIYRKPYKKKKKKSALLNILQCFQRLKINIYKGWSVPL